MTLPPLMPLILPSFPFEVGRMKIVVVAFGLAALLFASTGKAEPNKEQYELQQRCGKAAAASFKDDNPDGTVSNTKDGQAIADYENHYNVALNKCFELNTITSYHLQSDPKFSSTTVTLFDVNEHKDYGSFYIRSIDAAPFMCKVLETFCHSEDEWKALIKAFMEG